MKISPIPALSTLGQTLRRIPSLGEIRGFFNQLDDRQRQQFVHLQNSVALILGRVAASGLGFLTWLITARLFAAHEVGIASGVVSAMMLCVQLALFGVGSALILLYPQVQNRPARLVNTALSIVTGLAAVTALLFLLLSTTLFQELRVVSQEPLYAALFLTITLFGAVNVLFDHISIALHKGGQVLARNVLFGVTTILMAAVLPLLLGARESRTIIYAWTLAGLLACSLGIWHLFRSLPAYRFRLQADGALGRRLVGIGLPNYLLTLAERAPNWILPLLITELLSPTDNAHWYAVWMMAWVVFLVPISIGQNLFAEISRSKNSFQPPVRRSLRNALWIGSAAVCLVALAAPWMLSLMGREYAAAGTLPLRMLILTVFPVTFLQMYYAICRGTHRLMEATLTGGISGLAGIGAAIYAGTMYGLTGMAAAWLIIQSAAGLWAVVRIRRLQSLSTLHGVGQSYPDAQPEDSL